MIVGMLEGVAYNSDAKVFGIEGIAPTLRAEMHGHLPLILENEKVDDTIPPRIFQGWH